MEDYSEEHSIGSDFGIADVIGEEDGQSHEVGEDGDQDMGEQGSSDEDLDHFPLKTLEQLMPL